MAERAEQNKLQALSDELKLLQADHQTIVAAKEQLETQLRENLGVQEEFKKLNDSSNIYKLIGPVLLKQEHTEAAAAVNARLEYIRGEIKRMETQLKESEADFMKKQGEFQIEIRQQQQQQSQAQEQEQTAAVA